MTRYIGKRTVYYSAHMPDFVRQYSIAGLSSNDDVALLLRQRFDERITAQHVAKWRQQEPKFERAVSGALHELQVEAIHTIRDAIEDGDVSAAKWLLERTNERFRPSSKVDMNSKVETLDERMSKRAISEEELYTNGVLYDDGSRNNGAGRTSRERDDSDSFYDD